MHPHGLTMAGGDAGDIAKIITKIVTAATIVAVLIVLLVSVFYLRNTDSVYRICGVASASQVDGGVGETAARAIPFRITLDGNEDRFSYSFRTLSDMSAVTAIEIRGPLQLGTSVGPLAAVLCGLSSVTNPDGIATCNTLTTPGDVHGYIDTIHADDTGMGAATRVLRDAIRLNPHLYYVEIMTADKPTTPGAARGTFANGYCGQE